MEDSDDLTPSQRDNVKMIVSSGRLLRHIVDDVLDYSKLESGAMEVDIKQANLQDVLIESVGGIESSAVTKRRNISIKTDFDPRLLPEFETDSRRLQQILYNLLSNAVKFSNENGTVEVEAKLVSGNGYDGDGDGQKDWIKRILRISVKDFGKGIERAEFENIFHPFTQTKTGISNIEGGTGLGLSVSLTMSGCWFAFRRIRD
jgi:signal transduction histidine kinase